MNPISSFTSALAGSLLIAWSSLVVAGPALDTRYGVQGFAAVPAQVGYERVVAACPHPDGGATLVALNESPLELTVMRLRSNGQPDTGFGNGGQVSTAVTVTGELTIHIDSAASVCIGAATSDPADDRAVLAVTVGMLDGNNPDTQTWMAKLDLATGLPDASFGSNGVAQYNLSAATPGAFKSEWVGGLNLGAGGEVLLVGHFEATYEFTDEDGMIARIAANGAVLATATHAAAQRLSAARIGGGGIQAVGTSTSNTWLLMQLDGTSLGATSTSQGSTSGLRTFRGRNASGGAMVIAASKDFAAPYLLVLRGSTMTELPLPMPPALDGLAVTLMPLTVPPSATGGTEGRAVVVAPLLAPGIGGVGYYAAVVRLGDGAGTPDVVETRFGDQGAASFRQIPAGWVCPSGGPQHYLGGVVSVGSKHLVFGAREIGCDAAPQGDGQAAMLNSDIDPLFGDSFD